MPAPRLLDKKLIQASLATERKQEIDKGVKIAKAVDSLKEERAKAETDLEQFRRETLKVIQSEITAIQAKKQLALEEAAKAEERKARALNATDVLEFKERLKKQAEEQTEVAQDHLEREILLTTRENDLSDGKKTLFLRETAVSRNEGKVQELLSDAESDREDARNAKLLAQASQRQIEADKRLLEAETEASGKELDEREQNLVSREETVQKENATIIREKKLLADRRATLERGFAELRRKQQHGSNG